MSMEQHNEPQESHEEASLPLDAAAPVPIWREGLRTLDWLALRSAPIYYQLGVPRGNGAPVITVPGFRGSDLSLPVLELDAWLWRLGYRPYRSRIGRNADCLNLLRDRLLGTIDRAYAETGVRVHLIGHSLGGVLARSAAVARPERVASVITLASPFRGLRSHRVVLHLSSDVHTRIHARRDDLPPECYTSHCPCPAMTDAHADLPASVAQLAIYTRTDGVVDWPMCITDDPTNNVEVSGSHLGMAVNPQVYRAIATHLADPAWSSPYTSATPPSIEAHS